MRVQTPSVNRDINFAFSLLIICLSSVEPLTESKYSISSFVRNSLFFSAVFCLSIVVVRIIHDNSIICALSSFPLYFPVKRLYMSKLSISSFVSFPLSKINPTNNCALSSESGAGLLIAAFALIGDILVTAKLNISPNTEAHIKICIKTFEINFFMSKSSPFSRIYKHTFHQAKVENIKYAVLAQVGSFPVFKFYIGNI